MARRLGATGMKLLVIDTGEVAHMWQYSYGEAAGICGKQKFCSVSSFG